MSWSVPHLLFFGLKVLTIAPKARSDRGAAMGAAGRRLATLPERWYRAYRVGTRSA